MECSEGVGFLKTCTFDTLMTKTLKFPPLWSKSINIWFSMERYNINLFESLLSLRMCETTFVNKISSCQFKWLLKFNHPHSVQKSTARICPKIKLQQYVNKESFYYTEFKAETWCEGKTGWICSKWPRAWRIWTGAWRICTGAWRYKGTQEVRRTDVYVLIEFIQIT